MEKRYRAKVVIPVYRPTLSEGEQASLHNTFDKLGRWPIVLLKPQGLDISAVTAGLPPCEELEVSDEWIGSRNGIHGYNVMMMSSAFYELFADTEYMLICHTDAWIFRDELEMWCDRGYDCVAAPWVRRRVYDLPLVGHYMRLRYRLAKRPGTLLKQDIYGKVGNGGLSLRRVDSFIAACDRYASEIVRFVNGHGHLFNEDVFWATVPTEFRYPLTEEALAFAFDTNPRYCYRLCGGQLPFGCHSWNKPRMWRFWRRIITLRPGDDKKAM